MSELDNKWFQIIVNKTQEIKILIDEIFIQAIAQEGMEESKKKLVTKNRSISKENASLANELRELTNKNDRLAQRCVNAEAEIRKDYPDIDHCKAHPDSFDNDCVLCHVFNQDESR